MNRFIATLTALVLLLAAAAARAQSVRWEPPGGSLPVGQTTQVRLLFEGCSPQGTPVPPHVDGLVLQYSGQASNISMGNGTVTQTVEVAYAALLSDRQSVEIPAFSVDTDKGSLPVKAVRFDPASGSTLGSTGVPVENVAEAHLTTSEPAVWAGEVFDLKYNIEADSSFNPDYGHPGLPDWNASPLLAEDWHPAAAYKSDHAGEPREGITTEARAIARNPGRFTLAPAHQLVNFNVSVGGFGFMTMRQIEQVQIPAPGPTLEVRPLPPAPAGFDGAVGSFKITSHIVPTQVAVNEPITWTVDLSGTGNWPDIPGLPTREVSKDFRVIQPKPRRTQADGRLFDGSLSEDVILMPASPGTYTLPDVTFIAFNPRSGSYETLTAPGGTVTVTAPPPSGTGGPGGSSAGSGGGSAADGGSATAPPSNSPSAAAPPAPPAPLPHDPIDSTESAAHPLTGLCLAVAAASFLASAAVLWAGLAVVRARRTDSLNPRRLARRRLALTLGRLAASPPTGVPALLHQWRADAAILAGLPPCAASGEQLGDPAWVALWSETDRALFAAQSPLPADWIARARIALRLRTVPRLRWSRLLQRGNLFPAVLAVLAACALSPSLRAGGAAALEYRRGDFQAAEKALRMDLDADPCNWAARHDLALALAQQDRWGEAAAEAAAAFVQHPSDARVRHTLALTCAQAGYEPDPLEIFLEGRLLPDAACAASPAQWQRVILLSAALAAAALALLLLRAYGLIGVRGVAPAAVTLLVLAVLGTAAGWIGWDAYGVAADSRSAIVWRAGILRSIPTEADVTQKTSTLDAGNIGLLDRRFLGWVRLSFPNGESGWVRSEEAIPLWR